MCVTRTRFGNNLVATTRPIACSVYKSQRHTRAGFRFHPEPRVVWLGWILWQALKLDELLAELLPEKREAVPWSQVVAILVIGRLCEPSSELHVAERWYRTTALEELLGIGPESIYDERLYRTLDRLLPHKQAIEQHLVKRLGELFAIDYELLLYDVTSTYFEGQADPKIAKRGYSRDQRPDCVQVNIALVVTREGMPLGYEIFPGNTTDVTTVQEIVERMEARFGRAHRVWVMDRGMTSAKNLAWLNATGRRYVVGTPRAELRRFSAEVADKTNWRRIREDIEVKILAGPDGKETFLLCRSAERIKKSRPCMNASHNASRKGLPHSRAASTRARPHWIAVPLSARSEGFCRRIRAPLPATRSQSPRSVLYPAASNSSGTDVASGMIGPAPVKVPTFYAATLPTGAMRNFGRPICSSPRPKPHSAFTNPSSACVLSGITRQTASKPISWFASSLMCSGRRFSSGSHAPAWATHRARS